MPSRAASHSAQPTSLGAGRARASREGLGRRCQARLAGSSTIASRAVSSPLSDLERGRREGKRPRFLPARPRPSLPRRPPSWPRRASSPARSHRPRPRPATPTRGGGPRASGCRGRAGWGGPLASPWQRPGPACSAGPRRPRPVAGSGLFTGTMSPGLWLVVPARRLVLAGLRGRALLFPEPPFPPWMFGEDK